MHFKIEASVLFYELRTYLEEGVLGATLDIIRPPDITGFDMVAALKAPHISSFVSFYRVILKYYFIFSKVISLRQVAPGLMKCGTWWAVALILAIEIGAEMLFVITCQEIGIVKENVPKVSQKSYLAKVVLVERVT